MSANDVDKGMQDIAATITEARGASRAANKVGLTGYCLGGFMSCPSAARTVADAFVAYYGAGSGNYLPGAVAEK